MTDADLAALSEPHPFTWKTIENEPKVMRRCLLRAHRTMEYEILHTGGFVRLCTERGRVYWLAQNEQDHRSPDWKLHFSVKPQHVPLAWDILTKLFMERACDFGMKAVSGDALESWPEKQRGRELTVYIFQHNVAYAGGGPMIGLCDEGSEHHYWLGPEFEREATFWTELMRDAEEALQTAGVQSNSGIAIGDLPLGGRYASLRNEAFVAVPTYGPLGQAHTEYIYPPNNTGWNAAGHPCPLKLCWRWRFAAAMGQVYCCCRRRTRRVKVD